MKSREFRDYSAFEKFLPDGRISLADLAIEDAKAWHVFIEKDVVTGAGRKGKADRRRAE
jgi:hypothetical protein